MIIAILTTNDLINHYYGYNSLLFAVLCSQVFQAKLDTRELQELFEAVDVNVWLGESELPGSYRNSRFVSHQEG